MTDVKHLIGERISTLRRAKQMTQNELAEKIGVDGRHISRLETGKYYPSLDTLVKMSSILEVELHEFFLFPSAETETEMRTALIACVDQAPTHVLRQLLSVARSLPSTRVIKT